MKKIILVAKIIFVLAGTTALADEMPIEAQLGFQGYSNCKSVQVFSKAFTCGEDYAQLFHCEKGISKAPVNVLAIGTVGSDVAVGCSPTLTILKFIEGK